MFLPDTPSPPPLPAQLRHLTGTPWAAREPQSSGAAAPTTPGALPRALLSRCGRPCSKQCAKAFPTGLPGRSKVGTGRTRGWAQGTISRGPGGRHHVSNVSGPLHQCAATRPHQPLGYPKPNQPDPSSSRRDQCVKERLGVQAGSNKLLLKP